MSAHWQVGMAQGRPASADAEPAGIGLPEQVGENRTGGAPNAATGKQSSWNQFLKDSYLLGVRQTQASAGAHAAGGPTSGSLFQLASDLSQALAGNHSGAVAGALRQVPRLSQWLQNGLNFNLGSAGQPGAGHGPDGPGSMARNAAGGPPGESGSSFGLGFHSSLAPSGMPSGSASATYAAHSAGGRLGFSASASAGVGGSSAGISSFGGSNTSGLGAMMNAQMRSGMSSSPSAGMSGGPGDQSGGPGGQGGPGHGGGGSSLPNATVHLKLTF